MGDFNCLVISDTISNFMDSYGLGNLIKSPTCFKSDSPKCIDLILTNRKTSLQNATTVETGLSDFHTMILTILKGGFVKRIPKIVEYRDYSKFSYTEFRNTLSRNLAAQSTELMTYSSFESVVMQVLNEHAPLKKKYIRAKDGPFMTKELRKAFMKRTTLKTVYNKNRNLANHLAYKKQRNKCVKMLRNAKIQYYKSLDLKDLTDNRKFWKIIKPVFSDTVKTCWSINLYEDGNLISKESQVAEVLNEHFVNITNSLGIGENKDITTPTIGIEDPVEVAIKKFESHPSILKISRHIASSEKFEFRAVTEDETNTQLVKLNPKKGAPVGCIPAKILKDNSDIFSFHLTNLFNKYLSESRFPDELKAGDITALFKQTMLLIRKTIGKLLFYPQFLKFSRD